jgi:riboflavin kinase/FMN adenylyltransferase
MTAQIKRIISSQKADGISRVLTLGSFDGIHLGHQSVINQVVSTAKSEKLRSSLLTFYPHPSVRLGKAKFLGKLTSLKQRVDILTSLEIEELLLCNFSTKMSEYSWEKFCSEILVEKLSVKHLIIGADARIGKNAKGTIEVIPNYLEKLGTKVTIIDLLPIDSDSQTLNKVSSRQIRTLLQHGDISQANKKLGREFQIDGIVIEGAKLGRQIGFPTANIGNHKSTELKAGVYLVEIAVGNKDFRYKGLLNAGFKPTVNLDSGKYSLEVHILDFNLDIYKKKISIKVIDFIRDEIKFSNIEELKDQINKDVSSIKAKQVSPELIQIIVEEQNNDSRLDKFLLEILQKQGFQISRSKIENLIELNKVKSPNKLKIKNSLKVKTNWEFILNSADIENLIEHNDHDWKPEPIDLDIIFEDSDLLIINKQPFLVVHPGSGNKTGTLVNGVKYYLEKNNFNQSVARSGLVHRIDKETSGIIVIAKNQKSLLNLQKQFLSRNVKKTYYCICFLPSKGKHLLRDTDSGRIETYIKRDPKNKLKMTNSIEGKFSISEWKVIERFKDSALLEINILTGRTHQIRVHMEYLNSAVLGDKLYGGNYLERVSKEVQKIIDNSGHQLLHAQKIEFIHPTSNDTFVAKAKLPDSFQKAIDELRKISS